MSTTVMMPTQIESAIREMCTDAMTQAVSALAEKYGFDPDDANRFLAESDVKIVRKRGQSQKNEAGKSKAVSKSDKPKRGKTGYLLYAEHVRADVKSQMEAELEDGEKLKPQEVIKRIASHWKALDDDDKAKWQQDAKALSSGSDEESVVSEPNEEPVSPVKKEKKEDKQPLAPKKDKKEKKKKKKQEEDQEDSD